MKRGETLIWIAVAIFLLGYVRACSPRTVGAPFDEASFGSTTAIAVVVFVIGAILYVCKSMPRKKYAKKKEEKKIVKKESQPIAPAEAKAEILFCRKCGNKLDENAVFCSKCGTKINENEVQL